MAINMEDFFNYINSLGIIEPPDAFEVIEKMKVDDVMAVLDECFLKVNGSKLSLPPDSLFNFSVNNSIAGDTYPCASITCRLERANTLSNFAALYSDAVVIPHFFDFAFESIGHHKPPQNEQQLNYLKTRLIGGIVIYLQYRPLIEAGIVQVNPTLHLYCQDCLQRKIAEDEKLMGELDTAVQNIEGELIDKVRFILDSPNSLVLADPEGYFGDIAFHFAILPKELRKFVSKIPHVFSGREVKKLGLFELVIEPAINDMTMQKFSAVAPETSYLTDRKFDSQIIEQFHPAESHPGVIPKSMEHALPFIENVSLGKLIKIRQDEPMAFDAYRSSVRKVMEIAINDPVHDHIKGAMRDLVEPEVSKIAHIIDANKKFFQDKAKSKVLFNGMVMTAGYVGQHVFNVDPSVFKAIEIYSSKKIYDDLASSKTIPTEARSNPYYFLWRIKREAS